MAAILHKVKQGETVLSICLEYKLKYGRFVELNPQFGSMGLRDANYVYVGEQVVVGDSADPIELLNVLHMRKA